MGLFHQTCLDKPLETASNPTSASFHVYLETYAQKSVEDNSKYAVLMSMLEQDLSAQFTADRQECGDIVRDIGCLTAKHPCVRV